MKKINFCSIGECMIEIANTKNNHFIQSFAGDTLNFSAYLDKKKIKVDYLTSIGKSKINKNTSGLLAFNISCPWTIWVYVRN